MQEKNVHGNIVNLPFKYATTEDTACEFLKGVQINEGVKQ